MPLIPLSTFARRVGGHPDILVGLLNNLGCPLVSENAVLHVDDNIALAVLRAKGLIGDEQPQRRGERPRNIGFSQHDRVEPAASDAALDESSDANGGRSLGDEHGEGRPPRRQPDGGTDRVVRRRRK